jgi:hypothetical protein
MERDIYLRYILANRELEKGEVLRHRLLSLTNRDEAPKERDEREKTQSS